MDSFKRDSKLADDLLKSACQKLGFDPETVFRDLQNEHTQTVIIKNVFSLTDRPKEHTRLAGAIAMWQLYRNSPLTLREYYKTFKPFFRPDVARFLDKHAEKLQPHVEYERDFELTYLSAGTLIETYLSRLRYDQEPLEIPQFCHLRVAIGEFCSRDYSYTKKNLGDHAILEIDEDNDNYYEQIAGEDYFEEESEDESEDESEYESESEDNDRSLQDILQHIQCYIITDDENSGNEKSRFHISISKDNYGNENEYVDEKIQDILRIYRRFADREGTAASPTIFNMGLKDGAPASCTIFTIDDSLDDILYIIFEAGMASKNNAGIGMDFSGLRHSKIGRHGKSQGIIPLIKIWDDLTAYINQGGRRPGALTASTRIHHYDVPEFIRLIDKVGEDHTRTEKINTCIMVSDLFMKRCLEGGKWTLFCPHQTGNLNLLHGKEFEKEYLRYEQMAKAWKRYQKYIALGKLRALRGLDSINETLYLQLEKEFKGKEAPPEVDSREFDADNIMEEICTMQCIGSMPYIVHGCNTNRKNNMCNVGPVRSSNLCQEIMIPAVPEEQTGCCNLASLALNAFASRKDGFDFIRFGEAVQDFVICLNCVIDECHNVSDKVKRSNQLSRPIGIGVNGYSDMFHILDMPVVNMQKLPKRRNNKYNYICVEEDTPDYDDAALKERELNPESMELTWKIWSCMYFNALKSSVEEAKRYGPYPNFWTSPTAEGRLQYHLWQEEERETGRKYPFRLYPAEPKDWGQEGNWTDLIADIKKYGLRNALLLTCMPTASSAQVLGNCESIEFHMQNIYARKVMSGDYPIVNFHMVEDLQAIDLWNEEIYNNIVAHDGSVLYIPEDGLNKPQRIRLRFLKEKYLTMWEIPQKALIQLAGQRQVFIDHSQSLNLYIKSPTPEMMKAIHTYTWQLGFKTGMYYLRTRASIDAIRFGEVANDKQLADIESQLRDAIFGYSQEKKAQSKLIEHYDPEMLNMMNLVTQAQEKFKLKEEAIRDETIQKTLMTASRPKVCQISSEGTCINCQ